MPLPSARISQRVSNVHATDALLAGFVSFSPAPTISTVRSVLDSGAPLKAGDVVEVSGVNFGLTPTLTLGGRLSLLLAPT